MHFHMIYLRGLNSGAGQMQTTSTERGPDHYSRWGGGAFNKLCVLFSPLDTEVVFGQDSTLLITKTDTVTAE